VIALGDLGVDIGPLLAGAGVALTSFGKLVAQSAT